MRHPWLAQSLYRLPFIGTVDSQARAKTDASIGPNSDTPGRVLVRDDVYQSIGNNDHLANRLPFEQFLDSIIGKRRGFKRIF